MDVIFLIHSQSFLGKFPYQLFPTQIRVLTWMPSFFSYENTWNIWTVCVTMELLYIFSFCVDSRYQV